MFTWNSKFLKIYHDIYYIRSGISDLLPQTFHLFTFRLQAAAMAKFEDLKEQTATGIQHAIDVHKYTDINIDLKPSYIIIPYGGTNKR